MTNIKHFPNYQKVKDAFFNGPNPFHLTEKGKRELWNKLCVPYNWVLYTDICPNGHAYINWYGLDGWDAESAYCHQFDC